MSAAIPFNEVFDFVKELVFGWFTSTFVVLGVNNVFEVGVGAGSDALGMPDICNCRKAAIAVLPKTEKE